MENFGKFIDDIRKEIKWLNVSFEEVPFGESMIITIPPSSKKYIVDTRKIGKIEYDTPMYSELLEMTIEHLKRFNETNENLNISDVICSLNCKCDYIVTAEQGHRIIKCLKCGEVKPI